MDYSPKKQTTISSWASVVVKTIAAYGHNPDPALEAAGIDKKLLTDPDARISTESMSRLWREAVKTTGDPCFGLKAALNVRPTTFHALGFALMVSSSMHDALERLHRYLQKENAGYREILDNIRRNLAAQYLKQRHLSVIDVAFRLGYSDSSNFTRAFKRWFQVSPSQYREKQN